LVTATITVIVRETVTVTVTETVTLTATVTVTVTATETVRATVKGHHLLGARLISCSQQKNSGHHKLYNVLSR
jgi:hypothetical protein